MAFFSHGSPFFLTMAARRANMMRSKLTFVGQLCMQDLQTRQLNSISTTSVIVQRETAFHDCFGYGNFAPGHAGL